jgi:ribonuclease BN (tRNA processing enzyme)
MNAPTQGRNMSLPKRSHCFLNMNILFLFLLGSPGILNAQAPPTPLELLVLGSGGPGATGRAASSYLVFIDGIPRILADAGPGSFARLGEAQVSLANTDIVLLTHLHIDHAGELAGLFKARAVSTSSPIVFNVWGPEGSPEDTQGAYFPSTVRFLQLLFGPKGAFAYLREFSAPMTIHAHNVPAAADINGAPRRIFKQGGLMISAIAGHHGDAPSVIYRIDHAGKSITFSGDVDAEGLTALSKIAKDSDLLVFNSVVLDPPGSPAILYSLHTPPRAIGQLAKDTGVHGLLLSHLSPATDQMRDAVLASIRKAYAGSVTFAKDGIRLQP